MGPVVRVTDAGAYMVADRNDVVPTGCRSIGYCSRGPVNSRSLLDWVDCRG